MFRFLSCLTALAILGVRGQLPYGYQPEDNNAIYRYDWRVQDSYTGQDFGQEEVRQGYATDGEYQVVLPDGRKQIVTYKVADPNSGYVADVRYEGEAIYAAPVQSYGAPIVTPAPYIAPIVSPAPYVAPAPTPAPYVPPAPVQSYAPAPAPYRPYVPVQPYQAPAIRRYNFQPIAPAVVATPEIIPEPSALFADPIIPEANILSEVPAVPEVPALPVADVPIVPVASALPTPPSAPMPVITNRHAEVGVDSQFPILDDMSDSDFDAEKPIYYSDLGSLKPQRKEKTHSIYY